MEALFHFNIFQDAFEKFDYYLKKINSENSSGFHTGYLLNLLKFNEFRNESINNYSQEIVLTPENIDSNNLFNKLSKKEKFIIINGELSQIICTQSINNIKYKINSQEITLFTKDNKELKFLNYKNNILDKNFLIGIHDIYNHNINPINNKLDKIYNDIINYFNNGKIIYEIINNKNGLKKIYQGILINKIWVDQWKIYSYYDLIKKK